VPLIASRAEGGEGRDVKRILIPTDGSGHGNKAIELGAELARRLGGALHVLSVAHCDSSDQNELRKFAKVEHVGGGLLDAAREVALSYAEHARQRAEQYGVEPVQISVSTGDPAEEILAYIKAHAIDMVVVGRGGRSRVSGLLLGSVSQKLASVAPCVVVICP
jgi:nucleotide-binding universal stress UspA family protein